MQLKFPETRANPKYIETDIPHDVVHALNIKMAHTDLFFLLINKH